MELMENTTSIYDSLIGVTSKYCYENGIIRDCTLNEKNIISTSYGPLIPQYSSEGVRRKYNHSISFYQSGAVKSISLEDQTDITTPIGTFPAELVTFYESGAIKRFFPLNGKITGYWTEEDEEKLCQDFQFHFPFGSFRVKIINFCLYENGNLKSMTLWPEESIILKTELGLLPVRIGFSLYEDGKIKSIEPTYEIPLLTPIGNINAYDENALGICGDSTSLCFNRNGTIQSLMTSSTKIAVFNKDSTLQIIEPSVEPNQLEEGQFVVVPLKISFKNHYVKFEAENTFVYDIYTTRFTVTNIDIVEATQKSSCGDCSTCSLCKNPPLK